MLYKSFYAISTQYHSLNTKYKLFRKICLRVWAAILEGKMSFFNLSFFLVFGRTLIAEGPECVYRP